MSTTFLYFLYIDYTSLLCYIVDMNAITDTNIKPFIVTVDGEVDKHLSVLPPRRTPVTALQEQVVQIGQEARLQARMAVYDVIHGTNYRAIRNKLARERRNREFEKRIGLERI